MIDIFFHIHIICSLILSVGYFWLYFDVTIKTLHLHSYLLQCWNHSIIGSDYSYLSSTFPTVMKYAAVTRIHKKDDNTGEENYRPISNWSDLSKVYQRLLYIQIYPHFGLSFESGLKLDFRMNTLLKKTSKKYHDLARVCN